MPIWDKWSKEAKIDTWRKLGHELLEEDKYASEIRDVEPVTFAESVEIMKERQKQPMGLLTKFDDLDKPLKGLQRGGLYVIGGYTGVGKTLFVCNIVMNAVLDGHQTLFLTTEMPHDQVTGRLRDLWGAYLSDEENFAALPIHYLDNSYDITTDLIRTMLQKNAQLAKEDMATKYEMLVVDNLQWFSRGGNNIAESTGLATQALKKMAIEFDIPILLVSHLNRVATKQETPDLETLKNSSYIEQDADAVIMLSRDVAGKEYSKDIIIVSIRKNRLTGELRHFPIVSDSYKVLRPYQQIGRNELT